MSEERGLPAIYIDGETKTGKGAASVAITESLRRAGYKVYYDVGGNFYRRFVAIVRLKLGLNEADPLPTGVELERVAAEVYASRKPFDNDSELGDLQRPAISQSVAVLSQLALVQKAGAEWCLESVYGAINEGTDVMVLDGRNPRERIDEVTVNGPRVTTVLDLYMTCSPEEAARRILLTQSVSEPTTEQLAEQTQAVTLRREQDRNRTEVPFTSPAASVTFVPGEISAKEMIERSWQAQEDHDLPVSIVLDNTALAKPAMLAAVSDLALAALQR